MRERERERGNAAKISARERERKATNILERGEGNVIGFILTTKN
jgi:hypothetical protein